VNHDRHPVIVRGTKYPAQLLDVPSAVEIYVRIAEMQLETDVELRIPRATRELGECVVREWVEAAKPAKPIG
jgi:hypothetical protein